MTIEVITETVDVYIEVTHEDGSVTFEPTGETEGVVSTEIYTEGRFRRISDGAILSNHITLGTEDSAESYEEVA